MSHSTLIKPLHAFRGIAIISIVAAHAWSFMIFWTGQLDSRGLEYLFAITETLFHGSTIYFAFISGMLFSLVLAKRTWRHFYRAKCINVLAPYLIISFLYMLWHGAWQDTPGTLVDFGLNYLAGLPSGQASIHLWYMPVLFWLFLLTPLLWQIVNKPELKWLTFALMLAPLVISRSPFPDFIKPQSFVYFTGVYVVGIYFGLHYDRALMLIRQHAHSLLISFIAISLLIGGSYFYDYPVIEYFSAREALVYAQKLLASCLLLHWLHRHDYSQNRAHTRSLLLLGDKAFAIYFVHVFFMGWIIYAAQTWVITDRSYWLLLQLGFISLVGTIGLSILFTGLIERLFGRYSRQFVGA